MPLPRRNPTTGIWETRKRIPPDLRESLGWEFKRSLGTRDPSEARGRHLTALAEAEALIEQTRAAVAGKPLTGRDAEILAGRWFERERQAMETSGKLVQWLAVEKTVLDEAGAEHEVYCTLEHALDGDAINAETVRPYITSTLKRFKRPVPVQSSPAYAHLLRAFSQHLLKLSELALARHAGDWKQTVPTLADERLSCGEEAQGATALTLLQAFEKYAERKQQSGNQRATQSTLSDYRALMIEFTELCGNLPITQITRSVIHDYRTALYKLPVKGEGIRKLTAPEKIKRASAEGLPTASVGTVNNKLRALSAVLGFAEGLGLLGSERNPVTAGRFLRDAAKAVAVKKVNAPPKHYTQDELVTIFSSPIFSEGWRPPRAPFGDAWQWIPLLLYYTGARVEEIAQLRACEVVQRPDGHAFLSILNMQGVEDGKRSVKTLGSKRDVPLHPDLKTLGFFDYVKSLDPSGQLFPGLSPCPKGYYSTNFARRWAEYLRKIVGLKSPADPCHGFRHSFKTLCRMVDIRREVHDEFTGHASGNRVSDEYGVMPIERLCMEIRKLPSAPLASLKRQ